MKNVTALLLLAICMTACGYSTKKVEESLGYRTVQPSSDSSLQALGQVQLPDSGLSSSKTMRTAVAPWWLLDSTSKVNQYSAPEVLVEVEPASPAQAIEFQQPVRAMRIDYAAANSATDAIVAERRNVWLCIYPTGDTVCWEPRFAADSTIYFVHVPCK